MRPTKLSKDKRHHFKWWFQRVTLLFSHYVTTNVSARFWLRVGREQQMMRACFLFIYLGQKAFLLYIVCKGTDDMHNIPTFHLFDISKDNLIKRNKPSGYIKDGFTFYSYWVSILYRNHHWTLSVLTNKETYCLYYWVVTQVKNKTQLMDFEIHRNPLTLKDSWNVESHFFFPFANISTHPSDSTQWKHPVKQTHTHTQ